MNKKAIIIATPLFPPSVGGPAKHAQAVYSILQKEHVPARVVSFSRVRKFPPIIRHILYTGILFVRSFSVNTIIAFDEFSVGLPSVLVSMVLRKKIVVRIGGDRLWEKAVQEGRFDQPLSRFCKEHIGKELYPVMYRMVHFVIKRADTIVFPSVFYRDLVVNTYSIPLEKTIVIENNLAIIPVSNFESKKIPLQFIYAGRLTKVKNLKRALSAFLVFAKQNPSAQFLIYGEGPEENYLRYTFSHNQIIFNKPFSRDILLKKIKESQVCVLPSLSEASPNFAFECNALGVPVVVTRHAGGVEHLENIFTIDPLSEASIKDGYERAVESTPSKTPQKQEGEKTFESQWLSVLYK